MKPPNGRFCAAGFDETLPFRPRFRLARCQDVDLVAILQFGGQLPGLAVDPDTNTGLTNLRVNRISKINRCRAAWQGNQITARRETEDLVVIEIHLGVFEKFISAGILIKQPDKFLYPFVFSGVGALMAVLVMPVRGHTMFSNTVHFRCSYLHLDAVILRAE